MRPYLVDYLSTVLYLTPNISKMKKFVESIIIFKINFEALYGQIRVKDGNIN